MVGMYHEYEEILWDPIWTAYLKRYGNTLEV
jgi:hypothetical protein